MRVEILQHLIVLNGNLMYFLVCFDNEYEMKMKISEKILNLIILKLVKAKIK